MFIAALLTTDSFKPSFFYVHTYIFTYVLGIFVACFKIYTFLGFVLRPQGAVYDRFALGSWRANLPLQVSILAVR